MVDVGDDVGEGGGGTLEEASAMIFSIAASRAAGSGIFIASM